jgi:hypothetical protein
LTRRRPHNANEKLRTRCTVSHRTRPHTDNKESAKKKPEEAVSSTNEGQKRHTSPREEIKTENKTKTKKNGIRNENGTNTSREEGDHNS